MFPPGFTLSPPHLCRLSVSTLSFVHTEGASPLDPFTGSLATTNSIQIGVCGPQCEGRGGFKDHVVVNGDHVNALLGLELDPNRVVDFATTWFRLLQNIVKTFNILQFKHCDIKRALNELLASPFVVRNHPFSVHGWKGFKEIVHNPSKSIVQGRYS